MRSSEFLQEGMSHLGTSLLKDNAEEILAHCLAVLRDTEKDFS